MENTAKVIAVDFANRHKRTVSEGYDLSKLSKHTPKFEARLKQIEARRQAKVEIKQSCEKVKNCANELMRGVGCENMTKKDFVDSLELMGGMLWLVVWSSVMVCILG